MNDQSKGAEPDATLDTNQWPEQLRKLCHDLNNPLAVIMGQLEIVEDRFPDLPEGVKLRHAEMLKASHSMREMIREAGGRVRRATGAEE